MKRTKGMLAALAAGCVLTMGLTAYAKGVHTEFYVERDERLRL